MRYASLITVATLATFATAAPLDKKDANTAGDGAITDYGSYGGYGAYGSYGKYDSVNAASSDAPPNVDTPPSQSTPPPPPSPGTSPENFVAVTTRSGDGNLHLRAISASGNRFYINRDTSTYCPLPDCSTYVNYTVLSARPNDPNANLGLFTSVPGGQATYVASNGELGYTQAHSGSTPPGSVSAPFQYTPESSPGTTGSLSFKSGGWVACPVPDQNEVFQLFATSAPNFSMTDCIGVGIATSSYVGNPAWQYS